jgi:hypothetical protein
VKRLAATAVAGACLAVGCGGDDGSSDPAAVLRETSDRLGAVRSGDLELRLLVTPIDRPRGVGFQLTGPFALDGKSPLPVARIRYTRLLGDQRTSAVLTSTGREAFVTTAGTTSPLDPEAAKGLALPRASGKGRSLSALGLDVQRWIADAKVGPGPELDGAATDRVSGRLRTGEAVRDVLTALRRAGGNAPEAGDGLVKRLDGLVRSSRVEVITGREDRILRRLEARVDLRPAEELDAAVPGAGAVRLTVRMDLTRPNRRVEVSAPR